MWKVENGEELRTFHAQGTIGSLAFSPDGVLLASGTVEGRTDIDLWDMRNGEKIQTLRAHTGNVNNLVFSPEGAQLASASGDLSAKLWILKAGRLYATSKDIDPL